MTGGPSDEQQPSAPDDRPGRGLRGRRLLHRLRRHAVPRRLPTVPGHRAHAERRRSVLGGRRDLPGCAGGNGHGAASRVRGDVAVTRRPSTRASASPTTGPSGSKSCRPWASSTSTSSRPAATGPTSRRDRSSPPTGWSCPRRSGPRWSTSAACSRASTSSALQTDESFLASAFIGTGPDLRSIIVNGQRLFDALVEAQPETVNLVIDGQKDLKTLQATDGDFATFSAGLASLTQPACATPTATSRP